MARQQAQVAALPIPADPADTACPVGALHDAEAGRRACGDCGEERRLDFNRPPGQHR